MYQRVLSAVVLAIFSSTAVTLAATQVPASKHKAMPMAPHKAAAAPTPNPKPSGAEVAFVTGIQTDLMKRFPTAADAEKAGYMRYTDEDSTGAISYANQQWQSADAQHPSQLWYDVKGNLLGADFSVLKSTSPKRPNLWGINPARWLDFAKAHYHYIAKDAKTGKMTYGGFGAKTLAKYGGGTASATTVVKMGKAKTTAEVATFFTFPALWDLQVWLKDNPNGAFAEKNPNVIPSKDAAKDSM
jgi:hypothetical protein